jgi:hypothetical protein
MGCDLFPNKEKTDNSIKNLSNNRTINKVNDKKSSGIIICNQNISKLLPCKYNEYEDFNKYYNNILIKEKKQQSNKNSNISNSISINNFEIKKLISKGSFGKVYLVSNKLGKLYAMKVIKKNINKVLKIPTKQFYLEQFIFKNLHSNYIPELKCSFQDDQKLYLVTDFAFGGDLSTHIMIDNCFSVERSKFYENLSLFSNHFNLEK